MDIRSRLPDPASVRYKHGAWAEPETGHVIQLTARFRPLAISTLGCRAACKKAAWNKALLPAKAMTGRLLRMTCGAFALLATEPAASRACTEGIPAPGGQGAHRIRTA